MLRAPITVAGLLGGTLPPGQVRHGPLSCRFYRHLSKSREGVYIGIYPYFASHLGIDTNGFDLGCMDAENQFIESHRARLLRRFRFVISCVGKLVSQPPAEDMSFPATVAAIMQGSTETTFYVLAVYFGSVGIKYVRHAIACALLADLAGITVAILAGYWFFISDK